MLKYYKIDDLIKNTKDDINIVSPKKTCVETYNNVEMLKNKYNMKNVFIDYDDNNDKTQVVFIHYSGTNGKECSMKNSLLEVYFLMNQLEEENIIDWVQVLDINVDNADDLYSFAMTFTLK